MNEVKVFDCRVLPIKVEIPLDFLFSFEVTSNFCPLPCGNCINFYEYFNGEINESEE